MLVVSIQNAMSRDTTSSKATAATKRDGSGADAARQVRVATVAEVLAAYASVARQLEPTMQYLADN